MKRPSNKFELGKGIQRGEDKETLDKRADFFLENGGYRLTHGHESDTLSKDQLKQFFNYYKQNLKKIGIEDQTAILEKFMLLQVCSQPEAVEILDEMKRLNINEHEGQELVQQRPAFWKGRSKRRDKEIFTRLEPYSEAWIKQWGDIAVYIASNLNIEKNAEALFKCYEYIRSTSAEVKEKIINKIAVDYPHLTARLAEFEDVTGIAVLTKKGKDGKVERVRAYKKTSGGYGYSANGRYRDELPERVEGEDSLARLEMLKLENAKHVIESILADEDSKLLAWDSEKKERYQSIIRFYIKEHRYVLFPYLSQLADSGLIEREKIRDIMFEGVEDKGSYYVPYINTTFYSTQQERAEMDALRKKAIDVRKSQKKEIPRYEHLDDWPKKIRFRYYELLDIADERAMKHVFKGFSQSLSLLNKPERKVYLEALLSESMPILFVMDEFKLTKEELEEFFLTEWFVETFFNTWNLKEVPLLIKMGHEELVVRNMPEVFRGHNYSENFVRNIGDLLPSFTKDNQKKILNSMNQLNIGLWFDNLDYFFENYKNISETGTQGGEKSEGALFERLMAGANYWSLMPNLRSLRRHLKKFGQEEGESKRAEEVLKNKVRSIISNDFEQLSKYYHSVAELLGEEEVDSILKQYLLEKPNPELIAGILKAQDENKKVFSKYREKLQKLLSENGSLFGQVIGFDVSWKNFQKFIGEKKDRVEMFFKHVSHVDVVDLIYNSTNTILLEDFVDNLHELQRFLSALRKTKDFKAIIKILNGLELIEDMRKVKAKGRGNAIRGREELEEFALRKIEKNPYAIFEEGALVYFSDKKAFDRSKHLPRKLIDEYFHLYPEKIDDFMRACKGKPFVKDFVAVISDDPRTFAFLEDSIGGLPKEVDAKLMEINPLLAANEMKEYPVDYYEYMIDEVKEFKFFSLYEKRLNKIANEEVKKNGEQKTVKYKRNEDFLALIKQLSVLEQSDIAKESHQQIAALSAKNQRAVLSALEMVTLTNLDRAHKEVFRSVLRRVTDDNVKAGTGVFFGRIIEHLQKVFELEGEETLDVVVEELDMDTINALNIYYSQTCQTDKKMKGAFQSVVRHLLRGDYLDWRFWGEPLKPNLDKDGLFEGLRDQNLLPSEMTSYQYQRWVEDDTVSFEELLEVSPKDVRRQIATIFEQGIANAHITEEDLKIDIRRVVSDIGRANLPLKDLGQEAAALRKRLKSGELTEEESERLNELKVLIVEQKKKSQAELSEKRSLEMLYRLQKLTDKELSSGMVNTQGKAVKFQAGLRLLKQKFAESHPDFYQDLERIEKLLNQMGQKVATSSLTMTDKVDFGTYLRIGEKPVNSCQHFKGNSDYNSGLLSYLSDPNVKMIQIYDEHETIIARAALRLLEDDSGNPVLFMESVYSVNAHPKIEESVRAFAEDKARKMGLPICSLPQKASSRESEPISIKSKASRSPHVYSDASRGLMKDGVYSIPHVICEKVS